MKSIGTSFIALGLALASPMAVLADAPAPAAITTVAKPSPEASKAWGFDKSDLTPDAAIRWGVLPNGMKYAIMRNKTPLDATSVHFRIDMGATAEADNQQGLAHFLEHMAFNGSKRVPEGETVKILERLGLAFGADTNAGTGSGTTIYRFDLPRSDQKSIDTALMLMRETASELTISKGAVDRERGIILEDIRTHDNFGERKRNDLVNFLFPGTPFARRNPSGLPAVLKTAPPERIRDLYDRYYTPDRATLVIVGDVDVAQVEAKITAKFGDWKATKRETGNPMAGTIDAKRPFSTRFYVDPDVPTGVLISLVSPFDTRPDSVEKRRADLIEGLGIAMLNRRLASITREADAPFNAAEAGAEGVEWTAMLRQINATARERDWQRALMGIETELRRATTHGFSEAELKEQLANYRTSLTNAVASAATRHSAGLAGSIAGLPKGYVFVTAQSGLERFEATAKTLTVDQVNKAFREAWTSSAPLIHVSHNKAVDNGETLIAQVFDKSHAVAVAPPKAAETKAFAYTDFGKAGTVAADKRITDLDVRTVRFSNNVLLNIKKTDFQQKSVLVSLRVGRGILDVPAKYEGMAMFMSSTFAAGGTKAHSANELQSILAGRTVQRGLSIGDDSFGATARTTPQDLELQLQMLAAYVTSPGYRPEAEARWQRGIGVLLPQLASSPIGVWQREASRILHDGDKRFGIAAETELRSRNFGELKSVLEAPLSSAPIEIAIVGDVDEAQAIALVGKTFGALPQRKAPPAKYEKDKSVHFSRDRKPITLTHTGKADQALVVTTWPTTDDTNTTRSTRRSLLASVMQIMASEVLREKLGATYTPEVSASSSSIFSGYGTILAAGTVTPQNADLVFGAIDKIAASLSAKPITADLLERARKPMLEGIIKNRRENAAWIALIDEAQTNSKDLDDFRNAEKILRAITPAQIQAEAKTWFKPKEALRIRVVPQASK